MDILYRKW